MDYRTVFVFICRDADCSKENNASNIRVFRSQLQRDNEFYPPDPAKVSLIQIQERKKEIIHCRNSLKLHLQYLEITSNQFWVSCCPHIHQNSDIRLMCMVTLMHVACRPSPHKHSCTISRLLASPLQSYFLFLHNNFWLYLYLAFVML